MPDPNEPIPEKANNPQPHQSRRAQRLIIWAQVTVAVAQAIAEILRIFT